MLKKLNDVKDDEIIADISRVARLLNANKLSLTEYLNYGGKYPIEIINDIDSGGFANKCEMAGIKVKKD